MSNKLKITIIDYGSGNLHSAKKAFARALEESGRSGEVVVSSKASDVADASHIVLPGVGAFGDCATGLTNATGIISEIKKQVLENKKPFLGICVGMQLLADVGYESGAHDGLGFISGEVSKLELVDKSLKLPHMGWNEIYVKNECGLTEGVNGKDFYFVHSYAFGTDAKNIAATCNYDKDFCAIVKKDNIMGVQFHPEKSQQNGLKLLTNFIKNFG